MTTLTDSELFNNYATACCLYGQANSVSKSYPVPDVDFKLMDKKGVITIVEWNHDSIQPTETQLRAVLLTDIQTLKKNDRAKKNLIRNNDAVKDFLINVERRLCALEGSVITDVDAENNIVNYLISKMV